MSPIIYSRLVFHSIFLSILSFFPSFQCIWSWFWLCHLWSLHWLCAWCRGALVSLIVLGVDASVMLILLRNVSLFGAFCASIHRNKCGVAFFTTFIISSWSHVVCHYFFALAFVAISVPQSFLFPFPFPLRGHLHLVVVRTQVPKGLLVAGGILTRILSF